MQDLECSQVMSGGFLTNWNRLAACKKPTIAAVNGFAVWHSVSIYSFLSFTAFWSMAEINSKIYIIHPWNPFSYQQFIILLSFYSFFGCFHFISFWLGVLEIL